MMSAVAVVGAGLGGLAAAHDLASDHAPTVIDRLPAPGGVLGYEHPVVRALGNRCREAGVVFLLGTTALRWEPPRLLVAGPRGIEWLAADWLVYAGGARPALQAELGISGPRLAGVLPAPVAIHLAEAGVRLGRRVCIVGLGDWAERSALVLGARGSELIGVAAHATPNPGVAHDEWIGWRATGVSGTGRVSALTISRDGIERRIACDCVVLAADVRPLRNVDGAIREGPRVAFAQAAADRITSEDVTRAALAATASIRQQTGGTAS
jgi:NADPH-dependent 2,4-dienoyl-CoA reductase/sulfur reductase-like enzyme